ncbi:hypothetical protein ACHHYP_10088 [Achlya hypogyna]|uniref:ZNF380 coiled-coil domain-containing protein n=1 Tax=Achlya hypogyna TaxID=1202772 RepID=A0A1V9ZIA4_ACHHY|nr:hypothetical protein ACHHYP_10088 [Achlya hypogyna]
MSNKRKELPVGFFDDPLADAKARKVNIKEEVAKAQEKEWEEFQSFVAAVETEEKDEDGTKLDEAVHEVVLEKLEQMEYMERVRKTLLRASQKEKGEDIDVETSNPEGTVDDGRDGDAEEHVNIMTEVLKARSKIKAQKVQAAEDDDDDDLLDWRAKRH